MSHENFEDDMYLSMSIASYGPKTFPNNHKKLSLEKNPLDCSDIDGAKPRDRYSELKKPDLSNPADIDGASSKVIHKTRRGPNYALMIDDIEGARARIRDKFHLTKRHIDPLVPQYPLPSYTTPDPYEPKFLRDSIDISDIEGARPKPTIRYETRDTLKTEDVEGAHAGWRPRHS